VGDRVKVTLLQHTPEPEKTVALAARLCYSAATIGDLQEKLSSSDVASFLEKIMSLGHQSVLSTSPSPSASRGSPGPAPTSW